MVEEMRTGEDADGIAQAVRAAEARVAEVRALGGGTLIDAIPQAAFEAWDGSGERAIVGAPRAAKVPSV